MHTVPYAHFDNMQSVHRGMDLARFLYMHSPMLNYDTDRCHQLWLIKFN